ncbi:PaaI family thioesterase [Aestuariivivens sediminicola]|uniref:PaaI family thioesterase n=1 Tax=Aestuariivivens sediminicola TaxID=2913560 RepID=UPI001F572F1E|nr:PaaI family thioesterase [Aestuariivivens sediminicola]
MPLSKEAVIREANRICKNTLMETLNIEVIDYGEDFIIGRMPVTPKVHQPDGVLHGGATLALAESMGSFATHFFTDIERYFVRGIELSANHLKSVREGYVYARASFVHKGRSTQLLQIRVTDNQDNLISLCKLTTISLPRTTE